jgi:hypothetical protein
VNKRVAVRRIETRPHDYFLNFTVTVKHNTATSTTDVPVRCQIPSSYSIQEAGSAITVAFQNAVDPAYNSNAVWFLYHPESHSVDFGIGGSSGVGAKTYTIKEGVNNDLLRLLNFPIERKAEIYGVSTNAPFHFPNVRSRQQGDIFLHSSFVSSTTAGYLGRDPEFYPKPNKMYVDDGQNFFYIETSLDGYNRVPLPYEKFILELTYIIDADNYQSP